jgi:hypothetical protein
MGNKTIEYWHSGKGYREADQVDEGYERAVAGLGRMSQPGWDPKHKQQRQQTVVGAD